MEAPLMSNFIVALSPANLKDAVDWLSPIVEANRIARLQGASVRTVILSQSDSAQLAALAAGAEDVWVIRQPGLDEFADVDQLAHVFAVALEEPALADFRLALLPAGAIGEGISAALASRLRATALGTCTELTLTADGVSAQRRAFGGRARITIESHGACIATIRRVENKQPTSAAIPEDGSVHGIELVGDIPLASPISRKDGGASVRSVAGAKVVVSGGRGMGGDDGFKLLADIAECLGGAVGGSLPSVDAGWTPVASQVGQSGNFVTPEIYIAVGISGTPQHLAGISTNTKIVALNKDPDADIFRFAEIGVIADWRDVLPRLIERLRQ